MESIIPESLWALTRWPKSPRTQGTRLRVSLITCMISQRGGTTNCRIAYPLAYTEKWLCIRKSTTCKQLIESTMRKHKNPICQQIFPLLIMLTRKGIIIIQKKIVRIISKVLYDDHTDPLFKDQKFLKFPDIYLRQIGKFTHLFEKGLLPNFFQDIFTLTNQIYLYNARNSNCFYIFLRRMNIRKFSFRCQGPKFFGLDIQNSENVACFEKRLKRFCRVGHVMDIRDIRRAGKCY